MNAFIKDLLKFTRVEGWNAKGQIRYPNSECDAFHASDSNQFYCYALGLCPMTVAIRHHKAIWRAHALADRVFRHTTKYFNHPTGRSYFNPKFRKVHQKLCNRFYERIMIRELNRLVLLAEIDEAAERAI